MADAQIEAIERADEIEADIKPIVPTQDEGNRAVMTPMEMVGKALEMGVSADILKQMMDLRDREEARNAKLAFNEAFAAFKAEAVKVSRNRRVTDGPLKGRSYAELVSFVEAATPALSKHGLSASWDITRDEKDWLEVTCTIEHSLGGSKKVALGGPPDAGGAKNALQARISTVTYLERATFKAALGLAEQGDDDDGSGAKASEKITPEQVKIILALLDETESDTEKFCQMGRINAVPDMLAKDFESAVALLKTKKARIGDRHNDADF